MTTTAINRPALRYHGGKWRLARWITGFFPSHACYVEPFGGAASVLLQKEVSTHEVYNDLDGYVVGFFRVLREQPDVLINAIRWTPYSRAEFKAAWADRGEAGTVEAARRLYIRAYQTFGNGTEEAHPTWRFCKSKQQDRNHDGRSASRTWNDVAGLYAIAERLKAVQIECDTALNVIHRFETPSTLFYVDPPYVLGSRERSTADYAFEMSDSDHASLSHHLRNISGHIILSGYNTELYRDLYPDWRMVSKRSMTVSNAARTEVLWLSPSIGSLVQRRMFEHLPERESQIEAE